MRFNKKNRKIRVKKKVKKGKQSARSSFWGYLVGGVVLLVLFYGALYRSHVNQLRRVREEKVREDFDRICAALILYRQEHGHYPSAEQGLALLQAGARPGSAPYLKHVPMDPWGQPYRYELPGHEGARVRLICLGSDGKPGGTGEAADIVLDGCRSVAIPPR